MPISSTGAQTIGPASGGKVTPINNLGSSPAQVIGANQYRQSITFHAPGSNDVFVAPTVQANGAALVPSNVLLGGCFRVPAGGPPLTLTGECQTPWQAFVLAGTNQPLTVSESNV